jgi:hypothetical protein
VPPAPALAKKGPCSKDPEARLENIVTIKDATPYDKKDHKTINIHTGKTVALVVL